MDVGGNLLSLIVLLFDYINNSLFFYLLLTTMDNCVHCSVDTVL